ncbi:MAG: long-chain fatty acid--CoA ligase [Hylemonella sp.]|uniref:LuxE/PaaK family acyltransferase n=1 Tax=Hylemonella sp. TaxID=2066020 RepID=UPI0022C8CE18|nr:long-chain fatty acid--CoA ligase [Hylemonella sp.]MCZ8252088.1 long-chain fatty acid--CoA ligase [Hylemonella sp.]
MPELLAFIARDAVSEADFNALALRLYAHQFQHNPAFQKFCQQRGRTPRTVKRWREIPAVPINGFKDLTLSCVPTDLCARVFQTSGTTRGDVKGRHWHPDLAVYDLSMTRNFQARFMAGRERMRMGILFPDEQLMPNSSLAHYLALALQTFGTPDSRYYLDNAGLQLDALCATLAQVQESGETFAVLGASYSFVHLMDALRERGLRFQLPAGSRLLDTGGFKGQSREMAMDEFYDQLTFTFGVPRSACINMYGMTELSTQFYDAGNAVLPAVKSGPHWIRSRVLDPLTGQDVPKGERGILAHTDLGNYNSVTTILTEDVGVEVDGGFLLLGRAQGAQAKGCSLAVDEFLRAARA